MDRMLTWKYFGREKTVRVKGELCVCYFVFFFIFNGVCSGETESTVEKGAGTVKNPIYSRPPRAIVRSHYPVYVDRPKEVQYAPPQFERNE